MLFIFSDKRYKVAGKHLNNTVSSHDQSAVGQRLLESLRRVANGTIFFCSIGYLRIYQILHIAVLLLVYYYIRMPKVQFLQPMISKHESGVLSYIFLNPGIPECHDISQFVYFTYLHTILAHWWWSEIWYLNLFTKKYEIKT